MGFAFTVQSGTFAKSWQFVLPFIKLLTTLVVIHKATQVVCEDLSYRVGLIQCNIKARTKSQALIEAFI